MWFKRLVILLILAGNSRSWPLDCGGRDFIPGSPVMVIARAGGAGVRPANTLEAFAHSAASGADILEMDLRMSKDGRIVVIEHEDLAVGTDGTGKVSELTLEKLRELDAGYRFNGEDEDYPYRGRGIRIPTLEEIFEAFPDQKLLLEMRAGYEKMPERLVELIRRFKKTETVLVGSRDEDMLADFRERAPEVQTAAGPGEIRAFIISFTLPLIRFKPKCCAFQVPEYDEKHHVCSAKFVEQAHKRGLSVCVYTIDKLDDLERFTEMNIDGVVTNYPERILKSLGRKKKDPACEKSK